MPHDFRDRLRAERKVRLAELEHLKKAATRAELYAIDQVIRERAEELLDMNAGKCWMRDQRVAEIVANALMHFDEDRYLLLAWCVMPNHVHVALNARDAIDRILHSWKSFSAKEANRLVGRHGEFWQEDYFDRTIPDQKDFDRTIRYVTENPAKAGLANWRWVRAYPERFVSPAETAGDGGRDARSP